ncbi:MAG TPA: hypothetical protein VGP82_02825 [Ktedonobacterales bacterium]|nr:hypothetical protein [Ktedonobacterales bacterium]
MLLDELMPAYDFREVHAVTIHATPERIWRALHEVTPADVPGVKLLFGIRMLPTRLRGRRAARFADERPFLAQMQSGGFTLLGEITEQELVVGVIGQFWRPLGATFKRIDGAHAFILWNQPNYAKSAMNFSLHEVSNGWRLRTETRVATPDRATRRKFGVYWRLIAPGSALIRRLWLRAVGRRAERETAGTVYEHRVSRAGGAGSR